VVGTRSDLESLPTISARVQRQPTRRWAAASQMRTKAMTAIDATPTTTARTAWACGGGAGLPSKIAASTFFQRPEAITADAAAAAAAASSVASPRSANAGQGRSMARRWGSSVRRRRRCPVAHEEEGHLDVVAGRERVREPDGVEGFVRSACRAVHDEEDLLHAATVTLPARRRQGLRPRWMGRLPSAFTRTEAMASRAGFVGGAGASRRPGSAAGPGIRQQGRGWRSWIGRPRRPRWRRLPRRRSR